MQVPQKYPNWVQVYLPPTAVIMLLNKQSLKSGPLNNDLCYGSAGQLIWDGQICFLFRLGSFLGLFLLAKEHLMVNATSVGWRSCRAS